MEEKESGLHNSTNFRHIQFSNNTPSEKMRELLFESFPSIENANGTELVLVVGATGSGKSTTLNYLLNARMQKVNGQIQVKAGERTKIGHGAKSETFYPIVLNDTKENLTYCDCAGFGDTRSEEMEMCATINTQMAIKSAKSIKALIIVIERGSLFTERANGLRNILKNVDALLPTYAVDQKAECRSLYESLLFVITKKKKSDTTLSIASHVEDILKIEKEKLSQAEKSLLKGVHSKKIGNLSCNSLQIV